MCLSEIWALILQLRTSRPHLRPLEKSREFSFPGILTHSAIRDLVGFFAFFFVCFVIGRIMVAVVTEIMSGNLLNKYSDYLELSKERKLLKFVACWNSKHKGNSSTSMFFAFRIQKEFVVFFFVFAQEHSSNEMTEERLLVTDLETNGFWMLWKRLCSVTLTLGSLSLKTIAWTCMFLYIYVCSYVCM